MASRDLLQDGMFLRVGNGEKVRIWGDKWIPMPTSYKVQSPCRILGENAIVGDLVDVNARRWNSSLIHEIFLEHEAKLICSMPLSRYSQDDQLIWRGTSNGIFTIRSAYHMDMEMKAMKKGEGSAIILDDSFWKTLWHLRVPNRPLESSYGEFARTFYLLGII